MTPGQGCGCGCCGDRPCRGSSHWLGRDATPNQRHDTRVVWDALGMAGPLWLGLSGLHSACTCRDALHSAHGLRPWLPAIARPAPARAGKVWLVAWVASRLPITQARCPWPLDALSAAHSLVLHAPNAQPPVKERTASKHHHSLKPNLPHPGATPEQSCLDMFPRSPTPSGQRANLSRPSLSLPRCVTEPPGLTGPRPKIQDPRLKPASNMLAHTSCTTTSSLILLSRVANPQF
jgi:hypothetical protein